MNQDKIGKFICELRKEKNLSQYQLADLIPISRQGVSKWERGKTIPDTQTLIRLSEIFDVSINELLKGERLKNNSIEELEETTLSILDQSNKKTKTIKRITIISITIIGILLLAFLFYYFINSYNSMEVYSIGNTNEKFTIADGIYITTSEKYYLKLGKIKNKDNVEINSLELYYKKDNKKIVLIKDTDVDNITIMDSYGYGEKLTRKDIKNLKDNLYLKITYNENNEEIIKLRYRRDYNNSSLFFLNQKTGEKEKILENSINNEIQTIQPEIKVEIQQTIQETPQPSQPQNENKPTEELKKEESKIEEQPEEPQEIVITPEMVTNKIKETCTNTNGTYTCEFDNSSIVITYYSIMNKMNLHKDNSIVGNYFINMNNYICIVENCEAIFDQVFKEYLFS